MILQNPRPSVNFISGDAGSGKSTLLKSLALKKAEEYAKCLYISCDYGHINSRKLVENKNIDCFSNVITYTQLFELIKNQKEEDYKYCFIDSMQLLEDLEDSEHSFMIAKKRKMMMKALLALKGIAPHIVATMHSHKQIGSSYGRTTLENEFFADKLVHIEKNGDNFIGTVKKDRVSFNARKMYEYQLVQDCGEFYFNVIEETHNVFDFEFNHSRECYPRLLKYDQDKSIYENFKDELGNKRIKKVYEVINKQKSLNVLESYIFLKDLYNKDFDINYFDQLINNSEIFMFFVGVPVKFKRVVKRVVPFKKMVKWMKEDPSQTLSLIRMINDAEKTLPEGFCFEEVYSGSFSNLKNSFKTIHDGEEAISLIKEEQRLKGFFDGQKDIEEENVFAPKNVKELISLGNEFKNCIKTSFFISRLDKTNVLFSYKNKYCIHLTKNGKIIEVKKKNNKFLNKKENKEVEELISQIYN